MFEVEVLEESVIRLDSFHHLVLILPIVGGIQVDRPTITVVRNSDCRVLKLEK